MGGGDQKTMGSVLIFEESVRILDKMKKDHEKFIDEMGLIIKRIDHSQKVAEETLEVLDETFGMTKDQKEKYSNLSEEEQHKVQEYNEKQ